MSSLRAASLALVVSLFPFLVAAQVRPQFEVAAIKPAAPELSGDFVLGLNAKGSQVHIAWASLVDLVNMGYRVKRYQISGPSWLGADHFTVDAKIPDGFTTKHVPEMLQGMLDTRFGMKSHWEKKELPVYTLGLSRPEPSLMWAVINGGANVPPLLNVDALSLESLPNALKNLGFKLERGKGFIDVLVIDDVQRNRPRIDLETRRPAVKEHP